MKTLKVGIASYADMKVRTMAIARGEYQPKRGEPQEGEEADDVGDHGHEHA